MSDPTVGIDPKGFLYLDGQKMPVKVTTRGQLEFCGKSREHRGRNSRFKTISPTKLAQQIRDNLGAEPISIDTA